MSLGYFVCKYAPPRKCRVSAATFHPLPFLSLFVISQYSRAKKTSSYPRSLAILHFLSFGFLQLAACQSRWYSLLEPRAWWGRLYTVKVLSEKYSSLVESRFALGYAIRTRRRRSSRCPESVSCRLRWGRLSWRLLQRELTRYSSSLLEWRTAQS